MWFKDPNLSVFGYNYNGIILKISCHYTSKGERLELASMVISVFQIAGTA